jgi:hypothetical protein
LDTVFIYIWFSPFLSLQNLFFFLFFFFFFIRARLRTSILTLTCTNTLLLLSIPSPHFPLCPLPPFFFLFLFPHPFSACSISHSSPILFFHLFSIFWLGLVTVSIFVHHCFPNFKLQERVCFHVSLLLFLPFFASDVLSRSLNSLPHQQCHHAAPLWVLKISSKWKL